MAFLSSVHEPPLRFIHDLPKIVVAAYRRNQYQTLHVLYFLFFGFLASIVLHFCGTSSYHLSYIDALTLSSSAICNVGLSPINLGDLVFGQQVILIILMAIGDPTFVHASILWIKRRYIQQEKRRRGPNWEKKCLEERALGMLMIRFFLYFFLTIIISFLALMTYVKVTNVDEMLRTIQPGELNWIWWSAFNVVSSYSNTGLDLVNESMIPFNDNNFILMNSAVLVMIGKTFWPVMMRGGLYTEWRIARILRPGSENERTLHFILNNPRHCHPLLFPWDATLYLLAAQIAYTMIAWIVWFGLLLIPRSDLADQMTIAQLAAVGFFQSTQLRAGGMAAVSIGALPADLLVFYGFYFVFSMYPFMAVIQWLEDRERMRKNGGWGAVPEEGSFHTGIWRHLTSKFFSEFPFLAVSIFLIVMIENAPLPGVYPIMFEIFSAYANNGLSIGVSYDNFSLCGSWKRVSKLILDAIMIRGRHRSVPRTIDTTMHLRDWSFGGDETEGEEHEMRELEAQEEHDDQEDKEDWSHCEDFAPVGHYVDSIEGPER